MLLSMLRSKIHRATVTGAELHYMGSLTVDEDLMEAAGFRPYEQVAIVNVNNGARFETYVIKGERGSGAICLNGAAARLGQVGDILIIFSYGYFEQNEIRADYEPIVVHVDASNRITAKTGALV